MSNATPEGRVLVIGAGLAGTDASWFLAERGIHVTLVECKTLKLGPAQKTTSFGELVCTNSLKSLDPHSAHGILKYEMEKMGSLVLRMGKEHAVPAGGALAVDRENFSKALTERLKGHPHIRVVEEEVTNPLEMMEKYDCEEVIVATGPLTTPSLSEWIHEHLSGEDFYFYDAIAPVVDADSLDYSKLYYKDRHEPVSEEEGEKADYLNAPLNKEEYEHFMHELQKGEKVKPQNFEEERFFESCLPVDLMAERGIDTARFSCMKPIGLEQADGSLPYACVQLRRENLLGSAFNLVGFQTRLTYKEQARIFRLIPGLKEASFVHLGSVHRNSFLNAKKLLTPYLNSREFPRLSFAGQMTGVEGYTESASCGLYVASQVYCRLTGRESQTFPVESGIGALINYIMTVPKPTPSNLNFGLLPSVELTKEQRKDRKNRKKIKKRLAAERAKCAFDDFFGSFL